MKKTIFIAIAIITAFVSSCSSEDTLAASQTDGSTNVGMQLSPSEEAQLGILADYISTYDNGGYTQTRSWLSRILKGIAVAAADALGACIGCGTAVVSSAAAAVRVYGGVPIVIGNPLFQAPVRDSGISLNQTVCVAQGNNIGLDHNNAMYDIFSDSISANLSREEIVEILKNDYTDRWTRQEIVDAMDKAMSISDAIAVAYDNAGDYDRFWAIVGDELDCNPALLQVVESFLSRLYDADGNLIETDNNSLLLDALEKVDELDLQQTVKQQLKNMLIVANASAHLWINKEEESATNISQSL